MDTTTNTNALTISIPSEVLVHRLDKITELCVGAFAVFAPLLVKAIERNMAWDDKARDLQQEQQEEHLRAQKLENEKAALENDRIELEIQQLRAAVRK